MPKVMSDCTYNVHKQLVKRTQFLYHADRYLQDAKKDRHAKCATMWGKIIASEKKNIAMLQEAVDRDRMNEK